MSYASFTIFCLYIFILNHHIDLYVLNHHHHHHHPKLHLIHTPQHIDTLLVDKMTRIL